MKSLFSIPALAVLLVAASSPCLALMEIENVSTNRAKELGVTVRSRPNGEAGVAVWLEFKTQGELKNFTHVRLDISAGEKRLVSAPLQVSRPAADSVSANFSADPAWLATSVLTIVTRDGERTTTGYRFNVKDFIALEKPR